MISLIGIKVNNRTKESLKLQEILTKYGCYIHTRIGFHPEGDYVCNNYGIVLIEVIDKFNEIYDELSQHWELQTIKF